jgi:Flp pilus assembly protein TadG
MSALWHQSLAARLRSFWHDEDGTTLIELAVVLSLFLLIFFGLLDFGRLAFHYVTAEKAMYTAARIAAVRPAACAGVPQTNVRGTVAANTTPPKFGSNCSSGASVCFNPGTVTCAGSATNTTANEIWARVGGVLPNDATISNIRYTYSYDPNLGFLGGPYVPIVTVEIQNLNFQFITPLSSLVGLAGATPATGLGSAIAFPPMSVSMPAEDLALGNNG